MVVKVQIGLII